MEGHWKKKKKMTKKKKLCHLPFVGEMKTYTKCHSEILMRRYQLGAPEIDGRVMLKCILMKKGMRKRTGYNWLRIGVNRELL
jgi:hypothetical protein